MSQMSTKDGRQSHDLLDLHQAWLRTLGCLKATSSAQEANTNRDRQGHSTTLSSLANARLLGKVLWVVGDNHGKRGLEFDWHQVFRKRLAAGLGSGKNHGHDQRMDSVCEDTSSTNSQNRMQMDGCALHLEDFGKGCPIHFHGDRHSTLSGVLLIVGRIFPDWHS